MTVNPHLTNINLIAKQTGISENQIEYLSTLSYPCGMHNCCYHMVYTTPEGLFAVIFNCGCEKQTVPDGSLQSLYVCKL